MPVEVWEVARPKRRDHRWAFRVTVGDAVAFDSEWVSLRYASREDAEWLAGVIHQLAESVAPGKECSDLRPSPSEAQWWGDLSDDCLADILGYAAHAEHMSGPRRGGAWYCGVRCNGGRIFHTADRGVEPKSGEAARWLCEVLARAASLGILKPYPD